MTLKQVFGTVIIAGAILANSAAVNAAKNTFSKKQTKQIELIVRDYLIKNPEVLLEVSKSLQAKQQQNMMKQATSAIESNAAALFSADSPATGNPKGNVTLVEFFDYQCIHCKKMSAVLSKLVKSDPSLRVVYKDFPIFGKNSNFAASAALAAKMQGKYQVFHEALLAKKERLNPSIVIKIADTVGLNVAKLKTDMKSDKVKAMIKENMHLAESLRLMGTPAFIVASTPNGKYVAGGKNFFVPGAASEKTLLSLIKKAS